MTYLVALNKKTIDAILNGRQTILPFWKRRFDRGLTAVRVGDTLSLRTLHGRVFGQCRIARIVLYDHPSTDDIQFVQKKWRQNMNVSRVFFDDRVLFSYFWLFFLTDPRRLLFPQKPPLVSSRQWVAL